MKVSATTAQTQGRAQTTTNTLQLWNWYAEPILKLQPGHSGTQHREPIKQTAYIYIFLLELWLMFWGTGEKWNRRPYNSTTLRWTCRQTNWRCSWYSEKTSHKKKQQRFTFLKAFVSFLSESFYSVVIEKQWQLFHQQLKRPFLVLHYVMTPHYVTM